MSNVLEIRKNHCNCHPETCCCDQYIVYCADQRICTLYDAEENVNFMKMLFAVRTGGVNIF